MPFLHYTVRLIRCQELHLMILLFKSFKKKIIDNVATSGIIILYYYGENFKVKLCGALKIGVNMNGNY